MVATASTEHPIGCWGQPIGCAVEAVATMIGCLPTQALAFSPVSIQTQRTQRKRLRLDGNRTSAATTMPLTTHKITLDGIASIGA